MAFGLVKKEEYEKVVSANNQLRMKMEKLRLQNVLLKDRIRVLTSMTQEMSFVYLALQEKNSATADGLMGHGLLKGKSKKGVEKALGELCKKGLASEKKKDGKAYYSIQTPDYTEFWAPKNHDEGRLRPFVNPG